MYIPCASCFCFYFFRFGAYTLNLQVELQVGNIAILVRTNSWLTKHGLPNFEVIFHSRSLIPSLHLIRPSNLEFCVIFVEPGITIYGMGFFLMNFCSPVLSSLSISRPLSTILLAMSGSDGASSHDVRCSWQAEFDAVGVNMSYVNLYMIHIE